MVLRKQHQLLFSVGILLLLGTSCRESQSLFEENSNTWFEEGTATWSFQDNELVGKSAEGSSFIMTKEVYKNFELRLDFFPDSTINSGVFVRCKEFNVDALDCHEINIWDLHPNQDFRTGAVVTKAIPLKKVNTLNKWNSYRIKIVNDSLWVWINDTLTAKVENNTLGEGFIGLQAAGEGTIKFRNIQLELKP